MKKKNKLTEEQKGKVKSALTEDTNKTTFTQRTVSIIEERSKEEWFVYLTAGLCFFHAGIILFRYLYCLVRLDRIIIANHPVYIIIATVLPFAVWLYSTTIEYFNFRKRKIFFLSVCITNAVLTLSQPLYTFIWDKLVLLVMKIEVNRAMTEGMVVNLARIVEGVPICFLVGFFLWKLLSVVYSEEGLEKIGTYRLNQSADLRSNKNNLYDLINVVRDLDTGRPIPILERDRYTGILLNGVSGTGKTSSGITGIVLDDLNNKARNCDRRQKEIVHLLATDKAKIEHYSDEFSEKLVTPIEGYEEEYAALKKKYQDLGITLMAPNNSVIETFIKLSKARNMKVNVVDPEKDWSIAYPNTVINRRINPFHVPLHLSEDDRVIQISSKATVFSEVLVALNEIYGRSNDVYFRDINTSVTTNVAMIIMLHENIHERQAGIQQIQSCITNFANLKPYVEFLEDYYQIEVKQEDFLSKKKSGGTGAILDEIQKKMNESPEEKAATAVKRMQAIDNPYYETILFVKQELLSEKGYEKMFDQARGLRNLINKFLIDPRIKHMLDADNEDYLDFDVILSKGEITLVNTAAAFSQTTSTAFGLFFQLNFRIAVLRRPEYDRSPHTLIIDECAQYMHQFFEDVIALYRQFGIMSVLAIQSLSQMEKNDMTRYLKVIFQTCGTQIVYGRVGADEMKLYSELAGNVTNELSQKTTSGNSLLADNASISFSERVTPTRQARMEGTAMRYRGFQEVTIFTTENGNVMPPRLGKVDFLKKKAFRQRKEQKIQWQVFMPEKEVPIIVDKEKDEITVKESGERITEFTTKTVQVVQNIDKPYQEKTERIEEIDFAALLRGDIEVADEDTGYTEDTEESIRKKVEELNTRR